MQEFEDRDPSPYTHTQLTRIAKHLGLEPRDERLRDFVLVAREYKETRGGAQLYRAYEGDKARKKRECARKASASLKSLLHLFRTEPSLREVIIEAGLHEHLGTFLASEQTEEASDLLFGLSQRNLKIGRTSDNSCTVVIVFLISAWQNITGKDRVSRAYLRDALDPIGCEVSDARLAEMVTEARTLLKTMRDGAGDVEGGDQGEHCHA